MNKILLVLFLTFILFNVHGTTPLVSEKKVLNTFKIPDWASHCTTINWGTYGDALSQTSNNIDNKVVGILGNKYQFPVNFKPPYVNFLYMELNKKKVFLKFKEITQINEHYLHTYINDNIKVVLDYYIKASSSGNGNGGKLKIFFNGKLVSTVNFWASV